MPGLEGQGFAMCFNRRIDCNKVGKHRSTIGEGEQGEGRDGSKGREREGAFSVRAEDQQGSTDSRDVHRYRRGSRGRATTALHGAGVARWRKRLLVILTEWLRQ